MAKKPVADATMRAALELRGRTALRAKTLLRPAEGERSWFSIKALAGSTEIFIYDEIGIWGVSAGDFVKELQQIATPQITLRLNSPGGDVFDGLAIYSALKKHPAEITAQIDGLAASVASIVALGADKVTAAAQSFVMIHNPWSIVIGDAAEMRRMADTLDKVTGSLSRIYQDKAGADAEAVKAWMDAETWFTAQEAADAGLVDEVVADPTQMADVAAARARFDFTVFAHAPAILKTPPNGKITEEYKVGAARDLPIDTSESWDGPAAAERMFEAAGFNGDSPDSARARRGFLCYDAGNPSLKGSYKLPFADFIGGELKAVKGGVHAAASRLPQTDIPEAVKTEARAVLDGYEAKMVPKQTGASASIALCRQRLQLRKRRLAI